MQKQQLPTPDFEVLFENAPELQLVLSPDFTIIAVSHAYLAATMTERAKIIGRHMFDVFPDNPEDPNATGVRNLHASLRRVLEAGAPDTMAPQKYDIRKPDAAGGGFETRWWSPINWTVVSSDGSVRYIVHRVEDISDFIAITKRETELGIQAEAMAAEIVLRRQDLDAAIRELRIANDARLGSEEKFRAIFEQAAIGIGRLRLSDRCWIDANEAFGRMLGRAPEDIRGVHWPELTHPSDVEREQCQLERMVAGALASYTIEKRFLHRTGHPFWARMTCSLVRTPSGEPDYKVAVIENIEDTRAAQEALRASEQRLRSVLENMAEGLLIFDDRGAITSENPASTRIHGRSMRGVVVDERTSLPWTVRTYPDGKLLPLEQWMIPRVLRGERFIGDRYTVSTTDEPSHSFVGVYSGCPVYSADGAFLYGFLTIEDITEQARAESAVRTANDVLVEADRRKDEFLGMLSHELRNPLAPIHNALYLLEHADAASESAHRARQVARRQLSHLTRLVDDLLDVTRIARGKIELQRERVELGAMLRGTTEDYTDLLRSKGLDMELSLPSHPLFVHGDETRLVQIFGNLVSNAAKFTPPGGQVSIALTRRGRTAVTRIRDTGAGISPDLLPTVFEPFTQAGQTLARSHGGLGLGLAMVRGLTALHEGQVSVDSAGEGCGTEFVVELPLMLSEDA